MLAEPSGDPESRIGIRRLRKRMLWFFRFLASRPPVPLPAPVILAAWRCTPDWEPLPKKSLKATGRARQKEVSRAKALEVEYSSARRGPSSTLYFVKYFEVWTTCNILLQRLRKAPPTIRTKSRGRRTRFVATTTSTRSTIIGPLEALFIVCSEELLVRSHLESAKRLGLW